MMHKVVWMGYDHLYAVPCVVKSEGQINYESVTFPLIGDLVIGVNWFYYICSFYHVYVFILM